MRKGEATKQKIIEQTSGLFNTKGYYTTTLSDVMAATGLQKGGIYNHFDSKEELSLEVFRYNLTLLSQEISRALAGSESCEEQLTNIITLGLQVSQGTPVAGGCPILNAGVEADGNYEPLKEEARKALTGLKKRLSTILQKGVASGEFKADLKVDELTDFFLSSLEGAIFLTKMEVDNRPMQSVISTLQEYIKSLCNT